MRSLSMVAVALVIVTGEVVAQERFSFFHPSTPETVERMLRLADLRDDDLVIDLGSGDGLIPLTAAAMNGRLRALGVDIDRALVRESTERARKAGVADRVRFEHRNAFDAELGDATVVTMWLFPELMQLLRPVILERARPGTRILTSTWDLGSWRPDATDTTDVPIYLWIVPARAAGGWDWESTVAGKSIPYSVVLGQHFQVIEGAARAGDRREVLTNATLRGDRIAFTLAVTLDGLGLTQHEFSGKVEADEIVGTVVVTPAQQGPVSIPWRARRTAQPRYFATTGTALFEPNTNK